MNKSNDFIIKNGVLTKYTGKDAEVVIPAGVSEIGSDAFSKCKTLESVIIPEGVTKIGWNAFSECERLSSVIIPDTVRIIGAKAFADCTALTAINIPDSVAVLQYDVFYGCTGLTSISLPAKLEVIGDDTFKNCHNLNTLTLTNNIEISSKTFNRLNVKSVIFGKGVTKIDCRSWFPTSATSVTISDTVREIRRWSFSSIKSLEEVHIFDVGAWCRIYNIYNDSNPLSIAKKLYLNDELLENVVIPSSVDTIPSCSFYGCESIRSVIISEGVEEIRSFAFAKCKNLESVIIPESVTNIAMSAFQGCESLKSITLPRSVTVIEDDTFSGCSSLACVNLPNSIEKIGMDAFKGCSSLSEINIPDSVSQIGPGAFENCSNLASINIPRSTDYISINAFKGCENLKEVIAADLSSWCKINFYDESANPLQYADKLCINGDIITELIIPDGIANICKSTFRGYKGLVSVTIPSGVKCIGEHAFAKCDSLASVSISDGAEIIGKGAFEGCEKITKISVPPSVKDIQSRAFADCASLVSLDIPNISEINLAHDILDGCPNLSFADLASFKMSKFDKRLNLPYTEIPEEFKVCYRFTETPSDGAIETKIGYFLEKSPCTSAEWSILIEACNKWVLEIYTKSGLDTSYTELGFGGVSEETTKKDFYPANCLLRDGCVIGFYYDYHLYIIGENNLHTSNDSSDGPYEDTTYVDIRKTYIVER